MAALTGNAAANAVAANAAAANAAAANAAAAHTAATATTAPAESKFTVAMANAPATLDDVSIDEIDEKIAATDAALATLLARPEDDNDVGKRLAGI